MRSVLDDYEAHRIIGILQDAAMAMNYVGAEEGIWDMLREQRRLERSSTSDESE
jgi:hypothetical protein